MCIAKSRWFIQSMRDQCIAAQKQSGKIFEVGSQEFLLWANEKAKQLLKDGAIGQLNYAEGFLGKTFSYGRMATYSLAPMLRLSNC